MPMRKTQTTSPDIPENHPRKPPGETQLTGRQIDYLNILLLGLAFVVALLVPFEAFLFSYAVLGPLHYITEISWLNQRDFFLSKRRHAAFLILACLVLSAQAIYFTVSGHSLVDEIPKVHIGAILSLQLFLVLFCSWLFLPPLPCSRQKPRRISIPGCS